MEFVPKINNIEQVTRIDDKILGLWNGQNFVTIKTIPATKNPTKAERLSERYKVNIVAI